jgi:N-methylhydantoinase B/oxoprolinase/acetone carboxylase alpha subunit
VLVREQESRELRPLETVALRAGDRLQIHMAGGGGYGDPRQRGRQAVVDDVRNGYVSARVAVEVYGLDRDQLPSDGIAGATATAQGTGR